MVHAFFEDFVFLLLCIPQARRTIATLEEQLGREHQLRKTADSFLLDLQTSRREAVNRVSAMLDMQRDIAKHCKAVK